jgi:hypothetical protein
LAHEDNEERLFSNTMNIGNNEFGLKENEERLFSHTVNGSSMIAYYSTK